ALRRAIIRQKPGNIITIKRLTADFFLNLWTLVLKLPLFLSSVIPLRKTSRFGVERDSMFEFKLFEHHSAYLFRYF
ncbi:MAG: hypothetical protein FWF81_01365, partial [Defluviitaleaceae bacterium]|nr:hypothetical protein [Defluviitaleaceae bacterium]